MTTESRSRMKRIFTLALLAVALSGCSPSERVGNTVHAPLGGVLLPGAGATFPYLLYEKWFAEYQAAHPDVAYDAVMISLRLLGLQLAPQPGVTQRYVAKNRLLTLA